MGLLMPVTILTLDFKTKEELLLQPQTKEEHIGKPSTSLFIRNILSFILLVSYSVMRCKYYVLISVSSKHLQLHTPILIELKTLQYS